MGKSPWSARRITGLGQANAHAQLGVSGQWILAPWPKWQEGRSRDKLPRLQQALTGWIVGEESGGSRCERDPLWLAVSVTIFRCSFIGRRWAVSLMEAAAGEMIAGHADVHQEALRLLG